MRVALAEIERLKRCGKRRATPFSKGERKVDLGDPDPNWTKGLSASARRPNRNSYWCTCACDDTADGLPRRRRVWAAVDSETEWVTDLPSAPQVMIRTNHVEL